MKVEIFSLGMLQTNCYLLYREKEGIVIDPGENPKPLLTRLKQLGLKVEAILLTHAHFDHIAGLNEVRSFTKAPVYLHELEKNWLEDPRKNGSGNWMDLHKVICDPADVLLVGGENLSFFGETFQVIHTPGHSPGSVTYLHQDKMFSGDVLFAGSIGRTDLLGGNMEQLFATIDAHFLTRPDQTQVFPGHGPETTIGKERRSNPFLQ